MVTLAILGLIVFVAFVVEATAGFGATVVTVTLASQILPIPEVLAALVPVNLVLSGWLVWRHRAHVRVTLLVRRVLPTMGAGLALGLVFVQAREAGWMKPTFATFVLALATLELWRAARPRAEVRPIGGLAATAALVGGGVIHGLFACGGPLAVYVLGRELPEKAAFRATLSALWLVLNGVLVVQFVAGGIVGEQSLQRSGLLLGALVLGLLAGEWLHARLDEARFRVGTYALLGAAAAALLASSI